MSIFPSHGRGGKDGQNEYRQHHQHLGRDFPFTGRYGLRDLLQTKGSRHFRMIVVVLFPESFQLSPLELQLRAHHDRGRLIVRFAANFQPKPLTSSHGPAMIETRSNGPIMIEVC